MNTLMSPQVTISYVSTSIFFSFAAYFFCSHVYLFFSTKVAYYEYIDVGSNLVDPIIPRISVWEDNVLSKFRKAELSIKHIQVCLSSQHIIFFNISFFCSSKQQFFFKAAACTVPTLFFLSNFVFLQIKPIGSTLFCNEHINPSTFRGFYVNDDSSSAPPPPVDNVVGENQPQLKVHMIYQYFFVIFFFFLHKFIQKYIIFFLHSIDAAFIRTEDTCTKNS